MVRAITSAAPPRLPQVPRAPRQAAPEALFPDTFVGSWKGELEVSTMPKPIGMTLDVQKVPGTPRYTWTIRYEGQPARPYELVPVDPPRGQWAIDEKNGIVLDSFVANGKLLSQFDVATNRVTSRYELTPEGNLELEMSMFSRQPLASTGHGVETFKLVNFQRAVLHRA